jgi:hypothetical protein
MRHVTWLAAAVVMGLLGVASAVAEEPVLVRPFLFSVATTSPATKNWTVSYDSAVGSATNTASTDDGLEQLLGVQGRVGHGFTLLGQVGMGTSGVAASQSTYEGEVLKDLWRGSGGGCVAVGLGARHEWDHTSTLLGRISVSQSIGRAMFVGNVRFEHALTAGRDDIDVITSLGWAQRVTRAVGVGAEAVGEDLEGFWEKGEAEGGARVFVGPAIHVAPPGAKFQLSLLAGPVIRGARNDNSNYAPRALTGNKGYAARASLTYSF